MKRTIRKQMTVAFTGITICSLLIIIFLNKYQLQPYYINHEVQSFVDMYHILQKEMADEEQTLEEVAADIQEEAEGKNISFLLSDRIQGKAVSNIQNMEQLHRQMLSYIINNAQENCTVLKEGMNYLIVRITDPTNQNEYIEMWGQFEDGNVFLMRSPLESISESVAISSRFLLFVGCLVVAVEIIVVAVFARKMTTPILELAILSNRMANLDFEAKYESRGQDEIGLLGENFNRMSERLEKTISELKTANNSLQKDIERKEKMEAMRIEFLGNVSHELKTPIALIQGYAEGLKEGVSEDAESREFYCDVIIDEAQKMNEMVKNLLTLNQIECGTDEIEFVRINLTEMIREVIQSMEYFQQQKGIRVIFEQKENVFVWADEYKLEQVLRNYLSNAIHHVDEVGVVRVDIEVQQEKARVTVYNSGQQIPEEDLPYIWDKFYKVDKSHAREYGGNGIGLSIVKAIMDSFRQKYGVTNCDNGVEFWVEFDV